ncbi:hypothetical protein LXM26_26535 [Dyadobacter sp. LJ419]|uniref:Uncharacterized protein n=1 Tax=Dyadobacter chenwenxiniae TaxID=2906456 RepID=A0A9X1PS47_9BACT|nr:hypothetical protein [Dyadobacter chenwenxiniae]MCF0065099.1 hypothetical protein [Dyadobacter chenwenxiniae]
MVGRVTVKFNGNANFDTLPIGGKPGGFFNLTLNHATGRRQYAALAATSILCIRAASALFFSGQSILAPREGHLLFIRVERLFERSAPLSFFPWLFLPHSILNDYG